MDGSTAGCTAGKKRGRKPKNPVAEGASGEAKTKRAKQTSQNGADKPQTFEKPSRIIGDDSDNATSV